MLTDICVNLHSRQFRDAADQVLRRAYLANVRQCLFVATDLESASALTEASDTGKLTGPDLPDYKLTAGVHPHDADDLPSDWIEQLRAIAKHPRVCAIGEAGLDFNRNFSGRDNQLHCFKQQIDLAVELGLPLIVHDRESDGQVAQCLDAVTTPPAVVIHCFTGSEDDLWRYLGAGYFIGITGWITDQQRGHGLRDLVSNIPLDRLLVETDAPYLKPHNVPDDWHRSHGLSSRFKRRCEPAHLPYVAATIAECMNVSLPEVVEATSRNAARVFGFDTL